MIKGEVVSDHDRTRISLKLGLHPFVLIFWLFWVTVALSAFLLFLVISITSQTGFLVTFAAFVFFLFGYGLAIILFDRESTKCKNELAAIFESSKSDT